MKAIVVHAGPSAPQLAWEDAADPTPGPGEVLVAVKATAVNRADLLQARGLYPPPPGVSTTNTSPTPISVWSNGPSSLTPPPARTT